MSFFGHVFDLWTGNGGLRYWCKLTFRTNDLHVPLIRFVGERDVFLLCKTESVILWALLLNWRNKCYTDFYTTVCRRYVQNGLRSVFDSQNLVFEFEACHQGCMARTAVDLVGVAGVPNFWVSHILVPRTSKILLFETANPQNMNFIVHSSPWLVIYE